MQKHWQLIGSKNLILFFSGWAMDEHPTLHLTAKADVCTCFDYSDLNVNDLEQCSRYDNIVLIAWSTGVWAAEQVLANTELNITSAIAINGTPTTIHNETGIPVAIFTGTFAHLNSKNMQKFNRRMVGSAANYLSFESVAPKRSIESSKLELGKILEYNCENTSCGIVWDKAIVGLNDAIFPPDNQLKYWTNKTQVIETDYSHYPFSNFKSWEEVILINKRTFIKLNE